MKRCKTCQHENAQESMYCEKCGAPLNHIYTTMDYTVPSQSMYTTIDNEAQVSPPPPPLSGYSPPQSINYVTSLAPENYQANGPYSYSSPDNNPYGSNFAGAMPFTPQPTRERSAAGSVVSSLFYLWGLFWVALGLFGTFSEDLPSDADAVILIGVVIIGVIALILLLIYYKQARIRSGWRAVWILVASVLSFLILLASEGILMIQHLSDKTEAYLQNFYIGIPLCIYGLVVTVLAFI
ncbi:zinc ribbon domain-containing protein [Dictyobacter formicarum]|uniref:Zinc-ribbon domain-containing protein n=1 Tax=Dictyobacter formicarum TaxID=2778368 RepID=A0ABQ3VUK6_9CHLR|nr:zinc ribbon domain-containing protein [Dictyobacter formicarum]GHO88771.1 hypothetical protein KSZ_67770 [Dictyobacter formicarum]